MNANSFRLIFSRHLGMFVPVAEQAITHQRSTGKKQAKTTRQPAVFMLNALVFSIAAALSSPSFALPTAPVVSNGSASFQQTGNTLTVANSPNAIINWGSFSIGQNEITRFVQQSSTSAVLNRVVGQDPSRILGQLQSNGRVFLINPNGVLFGQGAQIDTAGLVASTLKLTDADFLAGRLRFAGTGSEGKVENQGTINTASGGFVYLIAPNVDNSGLINAPNGDILLAAGQSVEIANGLNPALRVQITSPEGQVTNLGQILAESGRIGLYGSMVANAGTISASSAVAEGGRTYLRSTQKIDLADTSKISADGTTGGEVTAIVRDQAGDLSGQLIARGEISAQGNGTAGSGGFIETSAAKVDLNGVSVKTRGGEWLIDPHDFTIASVGGDISGAALSTALSQGGVTILSSQGSNANGNGDINVNDAVSWSANTLTLTAARDININAVLTASGSSSLTMNTATSNGAIAPEAGVTGGTVKVGFNPDGTFKGRVDFGSRTGTGFLTINGNAYTVINSLGAEGSTTGTDLQGMKGNLAGYYALGSNIDASATSTWNGGAGFDPVGHWAVGYPLFEGSFNGLGHSITGLTINRPTQSDLGLFGYTRYATISNLALLNVSIVGGYSGIGGLAGTLGNYSNVLNTRVTGSISSPNASVEGVGGIAGVLYYSDIRNSQTNVAITVDDSAYRVGGLVGNNFAYGYGIYDSAASGTITTGVNAHSIGGLVGELMDGTLSGDRSNVGLSVGDYSYRIGGLVGYHWATGTGITNSYSTGTITGGVGVEQIGGLVGLSDRSISNSYSTSDVTVGINSLSIGGLVGESGGSISGSYASGAVFSATGSDQIGGLVGSMYGSASDTYATGAVTGSGSVGGLVGDNDGGAISNSHATGTVSGNSQVGGLVGYARQDTLITESYATGAVTGNSQVGGLVGFYDYHIGAPSLSRSYATGSVTAGNGAVDVGGLIGYANGSDVENSYATGAVTAGTGSANVAGLIGDNGSNVSNSYAVGAVSVGAGSTAVGGLVGRQSSSFTVTNSFWDTQTSGQSVSAAGTGKTTAEMKTQSTFSGWDFTPSTGVWAIDSGATPSYPYLRNPEQIPHPGLVNGATTCSVCIWDGGGDSNHLWSLAANWSGDLLPATASAVTIGSNAYTILYDINNLSLASLSLASPLNIQSGKTLTLTGTGTFNAAVGGAGTLAIAGAAVNAYANAINIANLNLSSGSLTGTGNLTVGNSFNWTGGTLDSTFQDLSLNNLTKTGDLALAAMGDINLTGGVSANNISISANGNITINTTGSSSFVMVPTGNGGIALRADADTNGSGDLIIGGGGSTWISNKIDIADNPASVSLRGANVTILGGSASGADTSVVAWGKGVLDIFTPGAMNLVGGVDAGAQIVTKHDANNGPGSGNMTIAAGAMNLAGGTGTLTTSNDAFARIYSGGAQDITVMGDLSLQGGADKLAYAEIVAAGAQILAVGHDLSLTGGAGANAYAGIKSFGQQTIFSANDLTLTGGSGLDARSFIHAAVGISGSQVVSVGRDLNLLGATGPSTGTNNDTLLLSDGSMNLSVERDASVIGGSGTNDRAYLWASAPLAARIGGHLTIQGGVGANTFAGIGGGQEIDIGVGDNLHLLAGAASGSENGAYIWNDGGYNITLNVSGNTLLQGGDGAWGEAFIGSYGTASMTTSLNSRVGTTMTSGSGSNANAVLAGNVEVTGGVTFTNGTDMTVSGAQASHLINNDGQTLIESGTVTVNRYTQKGSQPFLWVKNNATFEVADVFTQAVGMSRIDGTLLIDGTTSLTTPDMTGTGTLKIASTGTATLTDATLPLSLINEGTLNIGGTVTFGGANVNLNAGTVDLGNSGILTKDTGILTWAGGSIDGSGTLAYTNGGSFAFGGSGDRVLNAPNITFAFTDLTLPNGSLSLKSGGLTFNTSGTSASTLIPTGVTLNLQGGKLTNNGQLDIAGVFNITGGTLTGSGALANSGTMSLANQTISNAITNTGSINSGGGLTFSQPFTNNGTFNANAGTTTFTDLVTAAPIPGFTQNSGRLVLKGGDIAGNLKINGGTLAGSGTIRGNVELGAATLAPGFSPGTQNITGTLTLSANDTTTIEVWGSSAGLYDVINVSGTAYLNGNLNVVTGNGYVPLPGDTLTFMTFANRSGAFANIALSGGLTYSPLATQLQLLGPAYSSTQLPAAVTAAITDLSNSLHLGALSYETPLLYLSGQSITTASSAGMLTQSAEMVLPGLIPALDYVVQDDASQTSSHADFLPLFNKLILESRQETHHESRLICR